MLLKITNCKSNEKDCTSMYKNKHYRHVTRGNKLKIANA